MLQTQYLVYNPFSKFLPTIAYEVMGNPQFFGMVAAGYEGTTANYCIYSQSVIG